MNKSKYIKALEKIEGDPHIVINVLCSDGSSEAWGIDDHFLKLVDNGRNLSLFQVRTKEPINKRLAKKVQALGVKSVNCDLKSCIEKWREKFDLPQDCDIKNYDVQDLILFSLRKEIAELVTLNDDFIRLFGNKAEHLKYKLEE